MPIRDEKLRRQRQKQLKSEERALSKKLLRDLDSLVPVKARVHYNLNGVLPSKRCNAHLLEDLRESLAGSEWKRTKRSVVEDQTRQIPSGVIREGLLSCRSERLLVLELPSWRVIDGSKKLLADFEGSKLLGDLRGQCLLHFIDEGARYKLQHLSRLVRDGLGTAGEVEIGVRMRFSSPNSVVHRTCRLRLWVDVMGGKTVGWIEGNIDPIQAEDWLSRDFRPLCGVMRFNSALSTSSPWQVDSAMKILLGSRTGIFARLIPVLESSDSTSSVLEKMSVYTGSTIANLKSSLGQMLIQHVELHFTLEVDHQTGFPVGHVHARIRLPHLLGVFRSPWKKALRASNQDNMGPSMCDASQIVRFLPSFDEEAREFFFLAFFIRRSDMTCFHTRMIRFNEMRMEQSGQVFANAWEVPYTFSYTMSRTGEEADRVLLAHIAGEG